MRVKTIAAQAAPFLFIVPAQGFAQQPLALDEIIVSGGLTPVDAQSYARAVTVITAEDLKRQQTRTVADALRQVPGVAVSRGGGPGDQTAIRIRGSESNHLLLLVDGVEVATGADAYDFSRLTVGAIERIEVLRGPQSALYGAGATAGVINVITRGGLRNATAFSAEGVAGTAPSGSFTALAQGGTDRADLGVSLSWLNDQGWDSQNGGIEDDGVRNVTVNAKGAADLAPFLRLRGTARYTDRRGEFDSGAAQTEGVVDGRDLLLGLAADLDTLGGALVHTPSVSYASQENDTDGSFGPSKNDDSTLKAAYQAAYSFGPGGAHTLVGALQFKREEFENTFAGADTKQRDQLGYVLDYRGQLTEALFVQGGLRYDDNDEFDDFTAWSASASYSFFETGTRLRASAGRAQTNPTFFEQFGFIPGQFTGNPDLKPERNLGFDVGVDQTFWDGRASVGVTFFRERLTDEIVDFGTTARNLDGESDRQGVEFSASVAPLAGLTLTANYTFLDATDANDLTEIRRPKHSGGVSVDYRFLGGKARVGGDVSYVGDADDLDFSAFPAQRVTLDSHIVVNLNAAYELSDTVEVFGSVNNLFDEEYQEVFGYAAQPLTGFVGARVRF